MSSIFLEEAQRLGRVFISYTEVILGGMLTATLFFLVYAGVRANNIPLEIIAAVFTTLTLSAAIIIAYFSLRGLRKRSELDSVVLTLRFIELENELARARRSTTSSENKVEIAENEMEAARRRIQQAVMSLSPSQLETLTKTASLHQSIIYSTSRLVGLIIAGAIMDSIYLVFGSSLLKRRETEAQKNIVP